MANVFDQFDKPQGNVFDKFDKPNKMAKKDLVSLPETVLNKATQGLTLGYGDEASDALAALATTGIQKLQGQDVTLGENYDLARQMSQSNLDRMGEQRPVASAVSEIGGALAGSLGVGATKVGANAARYVAGGGRAASIGKGAMAGAALGGVQGYGQGDGDNRLGEAAKGAAIGGVLGGVIPAALGGKVRPTAQQLKQVSQKNYQKAEQLGGVLAPSFTDSFIDSVKRYDYKDPMAQAFNGRSPITPISEMLEASRGQPMTLSAATEIDKAITDRLEDAAFQNNGVLNNYGRQLLEIKNGLSESLLDAADKGLVQGGNEGVMAYREAVKDWAAQSQIGEIERIVERASYMDNPATALKTGFRNIATNPKRLNKFPKDVQKAIKAAASDGNLTNILRTNLGSRLLSTMTGAAAGTAMGPLGTLAGAAGGFATSGLARGAAESMQMGRVNKVIDTIAGGSSIPTNPNNLLQKINPVLQNLQNAGNMSLKDIMRLPPAKAKELLSKVKK